MSAPYSTALIIGAGPGLSTSLAHACASHGMRVALAARMPDKLNELCAQTNANAYACDASDPHSIDQLFECLADDDLTPDFLIYNAGAYTRGPVAELDVEAVRQTLMINAYGAMLAARSAAAPMLSNGGGAMFFTGASAGVKGYAQSAPFAMGKFALRGLCQSLARELAPQNIHVAHFVIDGMIYQPSRGAPYDDPLVTLDPDDIAKTYLAVAEQSRTAWTYEMELRPFVERF